MAAKDPEKPPQSDGEPGEKNDATSGSVAPMGRFKLRGRLMTDERHTYAPGAVLPGTPYKVERLLGAGGMGVVYVVRHTFLNRLEALKTIHPELVDRSDIAARMQKEAEVVGNLRHP